MKSAKGSFAGVEGVALTDSLDAEWIGQGWLPAIDRYGSRIIEWLTALAVLSEIVLLFAGIVARSVFNDPIFWADEVSAILFVWLAMLGSVLAFMRGAHMRLTYVVTKLGARGRRYAETLSLLAPIAFLAVIIGPAIDYAHDQSMLQTAALGLSGLTQAAAIPTGLGLMLLIGVFRLFRCRLVEIALVGAGLIILAGAAYSAAPALESMANWNLLVFFVGLLGFSVMAGVPIAFCFGLATTAYLLTVTTFPLSIVVERTSSGMSSNLLLAVPLFVFLGQLIEATGMARVMVEFLAALLGRVRGGMSYVLLLAMILVSGISGSKAADMAAVAPVLLPEMKRRGHDEADMVALLIATGAMSETIPPSIVLIAVGSTTGVSIAALFAGGLLPGIVLAIMLAIVARVRTPRETFAAPRLEPRRVLRAFVIALPALVLPFLIRAAVVEGVTTATEASTIGIAYAVLCGVLIYRQFPLRPLLSMLVTTACLSGAILFIIGAATSLAWALTQSGFSQDLTAAMASVPGGGWGFLAISIVAFAVLGSVLEGIPAIVLFGPLLFPIAVKLGLDEVHYALVAILAMGLGLFAPPFGIGYYMGCAIAGVPAERAMRPVWVYLATIAAGLVLIAAAPWIVAGKG